MGITKRCATAVITGNTIQGNVLYETLYPSLTSQPAAGVFNTYSATGDVISTTDRNGNVHQYPVRWP